MVLIQRRQFQPEANLSYSQLLTVNWEKKQEHFAGDLIDSQLPF